MQAVAFRSQLTRPVLTCEARDPSEVERRGNLSAVWALLNEIKSREPSRSEIIQVIGAASGDALNETSCARVADAVLALWKQ